MISIVSVFFLRFSNINAALAFTLGLPNTDATTPAATGTTQAAASDQSDEEE